MNNLSSNPEYAGKIEELTALMKKSQAQYDDAAPLILANPKPAKWDPSMATKWNADRSKGSKTAKEKQ